MQRLLEGDDLDPKDEADRMGVHIHPKIRISFSRIRFEGSGDGAYEEEHGWVDEEGVEFETDHWYDDDGELMDAAEMAAQWLDQTQGPVHPSSSEFYPGVWYEGPSKSDGRYDGWTEERHYHLVGFTPEEEEKVYELITV